ncbi:MAG: DNA starvation/stationary phase protection protein [Alphaproteobacteria bacterium CG11_big_fil_rev_8_21_14_0_20_44_7]|nr:MAG: DNA starvation/stationary phase protection protein [Alphaproteobacteria bacterium CG11_big_fil_rev_8_21_14_0_20_44_7]
MSKSDKIIDINHNKQVAEKLQKFLADSYAVLIQTQNLHWNIEGKEFYSLHKLSEDIYTEQFAAIDEIAERLRALGHKVEVGFDVYNKQSSIKNGATAEAAIAAQEEAANSASELVEIAEENSDVATADLATQRVQIHQKNAWMLRSQSK